MVELYEGTKSVVIECWSNRKSSYLMNMLQIALVIVFAFLSLPAVLLFEDRVDFAACVFLGAFIWIILFTLVQKGLV